jgi:hypothetical protein
VEVELTANHWGRFEMFLCPNNNPRYEATQSCFDRLVFQVGETASPSISMFCCFQMSGIGEYVLGKKCLRNYGFFVCQTKLVSLSVVKVLRLLSDAISVA